MSLGKKEAKDATQSSLQLVSLKTEKADRFLFSHGEKDQASLAPF